MNFTYYVNNNICKILIYITLLHYYIFYILYTYIFLHICIFINFMYMYIMRVYVYKKYIYRCKNSLLYLIL